METIGHYKIIKSLQDSYDGGRRTYLACDAKGIKVILKQFRFAVTNSNWSSFKSLEKEIENLKLLDHPNIPRYIESFESDAGACLVMEYLPGENLSAKRLDVSDLAQVLNSILDILVYLQSQSPSVIHRDIKPQNIINSLEKGYCLIDFGLAIETASTMSFSSVISGTPGFMPPELFRGLKLDRSADLYSLGVTVFCLLTGKSASELSSLVDSSFVLSLNPLKSIVNEKFLNWLECCLNPNPAKRFASAKQAMEKLKLIGNIEFIQNQLISSDESKIETEWKKLKFDEGKHYVESTDLDEPVEQSIKEAFRMALNPWIMTFIVGVPSYFFWQLSTLYLVCPDVNIPVLFCNLSENSDGFFLILKLTIKLVFPMLSGISKVIEFAFIPFAIIAIALSLFDRNIIKSIIIKSILSFSILSWLEFFQWLMNYCTVLMPVEFG